jgi:hypothetical protein
LSKGRCAFPDQRGELIRRSFRPSHADGSSIGATILEQLTIRPASLSQVGRI